LSWLVAKEANLEGATLNQTNLEGAYLSCRVSQRCG